MGQRRAEEGNGDMAERDTGTFTNPNSSSLAQRGDNDDKGGQRGQRAHFEDDRKDRKGSKGEIVEEGDDAENLGPGLHLGPALLCARPPVVFTHCF